jgi:acyl-CoA synthetase (AMP-forming)/AMP-acid ligase II/aryl carrier-like protein
MTAVAPSRASFETYIDILAMRARDQPGTEAFTFLADSGRRAGLDHSTLLRQAGAVAEELRRSGEIGDRVLLVYPPGLQFIVALFGCWAAGRVAVPAYPPRAANDRAMRRLAGILEDAQPAHILTLARLTDTLGALRGAQALRCTATDTLVEKPAENLFRASSESHRIALLQYTSGTTASPKGVVITHANLLHNSEVIRSAFGHSRESNGVIWLPPYHDMGLIGGILQPLYAGFPVTLLSPAHFLQRPLRWLQAISGRRDVTSGGPSFAYDLCVRAIPEAERATLDLSGWTVAFSGGEPVDAAAMDRFAAAFEVSGFRREAFYPCYGLAESTLMVSGGIKGHSANISVAGAQPTGVRPEAHSRSSRLVSCGRARESGTILIVDLETRMRCPEGVIGEIWVSSPSVSEGYWNQPEMTREVFGAFRNDGEAGEHRGPFLRTGDLGFLRDGELYIAGRLKDVSIVRGVKHHASDIERTVATCHAGVRPGCGAAFSISRDGEEHLVLVQEIERDWLHDDPAGIVEAIRRAVATEHELEVAVALLLRPGRILKTSSGKVQRFAVKAAFLEGMLDALHEWRQERESHPMHAGAAPAHAMPAEGEVSVHALQSWIASRLAVAVELPLSSIDVNEPVARYGLDSVKAVVIAEEIGRHIGRDVSAAQFWDHPTVAELARALAGSTGVEQIVAPEAVDAHL